MNTLRLEEKLSENEVKSYCSVFKDRPIDVERKTIVCLWIVLKILTCRCCRLFKCELNCFWFVKSILQTVHEKRRIDFVVVWLLLLLVDVQIICVGSGIERNEPVDPVDVEVDGSTEPVWLEFVFYDEKRV